MSPDPVVLAEGVRKTFGSVVALDGLDLEVRRGEVFGFLGPNGAGKSTTTALLVDLIRPTSGRLEVLGTSPRAGGAALRARIGYLPGELHLDGTRTAGRLLADLVALRGGRGADRVGPLAERLGLPLDRPVRGLSKGNKQKVGLVQAFAPAPELLVLDEPTSGLDPLLQQEFAALVREARDAGATVLMSSHVLAEVQEVADRAAVLRAGRVVDVDDVAALRDHAGQRVSLRLAGRVDVDAWADLPGVSGLAATHGEDTLVTCLLRGEPDALLRAAAAHHVLAWSAADRDLEDLFLDHYRTEAPEGSA
ncbi:ABC transporter ATP-binding protein [Rhodococcus aerolatus]